MPRARSSSRSSRGRRARTRRAGRRRAVPAAPAPQHVPEPGVGADGVADVAAGAGRGHGEAAAAVDEGRDVEPKPERASRRQDDDGPAAPQPSSTAASKSPVGTPAWKPPPHSQSRPGPSARAGTRWQAGRQHDEQRDQASGGHGSPPERLYRRPFGEPGRRRGRDGRGSHGQRPRPQGLGYRGPTVRTRTDGSGLPKRKRQEQERVAAFGTSRPRIDRPSGSMPDRDLPR